MSDSYCSRGLSLDLQTSYVCTSPNLLTDGSWVVNGRGSDETGYEIGSRVTYRCDSELPGVDLALEGPDTRVCQAEGSWSDTNPYCVVTGELTTGACSLVTV